jgi:hypothetical protein
VITTSLNIGEKLKQLELRQRVLSATVGATDEQGEPDRGF